MGEPSGPSSARGHRGRRRWRDHGDRRPCGRDTGRRGPSAPRRDRGRGTRRPPVTAVSARPRGLRRDRAASLAAGASRASLSRKGGADRPVPGVGRAESAWRASTVVSCCRPCSRTRRRPHARRSDGPHHRADRPLLMLEGGLDEGAHPPLGGVGPGGAPRHRPPLRLAPVDAADLARPGEEPLVPRRAGGAVGPDVRGRLVRIDQYPAQPRPVVRRRVGDLRPPDDAVPAIDGDVRLVAEDRDRDVDARPAAGGGLRLRVLHGSPRVDVLLPRPGGLLGPDPPRRSRPPRCAPSRCPRSAGGAPPRAWRPRSARPSADSPPR